MPTLSRGLPHDFKLECGQSLCLALQAAGFAEEDLGEDVGFADGVGGAGEDDAALVEDVGAVYDVEHALDVVLDDHEGSLEPFADLGDYPKRLSNHLTLTPTCARHSSARASGLCNCRLGDLFLLFNLAGRVGRQSVPVWSTRNSSTALGLGGSIG